MNTVYILLARGFEESEAIVPADLLKRAGANVVLVATEGGLAVPGAHGITVSADAPVTPTASMKQSSSAKMRVYMHLYMKNLRWGRNERVNMKTKNIMSCRTWMRQLICVNLIFLISR